MDLEDSREALAYWERRARTLPRHALRRRREARAMAARWRARVAEAETAAYGAGWLGALALTVAERRLPERVRAGRARVARRAKQAAAVAVAGTLALVGLAVAATVQVLSALVHAV